MNKEETSMSTSAGYVLSFGADCPDCGRLQRENGFSWFYFERCLQGEISGISMFVSDHIMKG